MALGFREQVDAVASNVRPDAQRLLFSATAPAAVQEVVTAWVDSPAVIKVRPGVTGGPVTASIGSAVAPEVEAVGSAVGGEADIPTVPPPAAAADTADSVDVSPAAAVGIRQLVQVTAPHKKPRKLVRALEKINAETDEADGKGRERPRVLIFVNKIKTATFVGDFLRKQRIRATELHSQLPQPVRTDALAKFRGGQVQVLVATDVAARGIDIKKLQWVVNYDMPGNLEQYVHRIGRVGRAGSTGTAITFFSRNFVALAPGLIKMLQAGGHPIDRYLTQLVEEAEAGDAGAPVAAEEAEGE
mmetsp:Transcript_10740/g.32181  ORF Transcript_10740/g.32181 Transcript_10740/m.32181 type:complete len:301 (+) Transcript_10740:226-1128(+)